MDFEVTPGSEVTQSERVRLASAMRLLADISAESTVVGSPPDPFILSFVSSASVANVSRDLQAELRYATVEAAPPDELRRAISINAIAHALQLPFETVRRRVHGLVMRGHLDHAPGGVVQNAAAVSRPDYITLAVRRHDRLRQFYLELVSTDALPALSRGIKAAVGPEGAPIRIANRVLAEYALRTLQALGGWFGSVMNACVLLRLAVLNERPELLGLDGTAEKRPSSHIKEIGRPLRLATETTRRRLHDLIGRGAVVRTLEGFSLATRPLSPEHEAMFRSDQARDLRRLFERLDRLGVLDIWRAEAASALPEPAAFDRGRTRLASPKAG